MADQDQESLLKNRTVEVSNAALGVVEAYLMSGTPDGDREKASMALRVLSYGIKVLHMNQVRVLTERGQALRLLSWLPDDEARQRYIALTNPQVAPLLLARPKE